MHNLRGFSIVTSPDFYANVRQKPEYISAEVFKMCDTVQTERGEVKVNDTAQIQREIGVDQVKRKGSSESKRSSEFKPATMQYLSLLV